MLSFYLRLVLVGGESLPENDVLARRQGGQLVKRAVNLTDPLVMTVSIVVQHDDLQCPPCQLRRRHVEHELFFELWTQSSTMNAALQLTATVWQQTQTTERVGGTAKFTRHEISSLHTARQQIVYVYLCLFLCNRTLLAHLKSQLNSILFIAAYGRPK